MENNTFQYTYSAARNKEVERIRRKYEPQEISKLETLKKLDRRVQNAGVAESLCLGIVGALVFGIGMCFFLKVFAGATWLGVPFFLMGAAMMIPAYPMCQRIARKTKRELSPEILRLSDEILNS